MVEPSSDSEDINTKREYFTHEEILTTEGLREQMIKKAYNHIMYWRSQYELYHEFAPILRGIEEVKKNFETKNSIEDKATKESMEEEA